MHAEKTITIIYKNSASGEIRLGYLDEENVLFAEMGRKEQKIGYVNSTRNVYQIMQHDDRELGSFTEDGTIRSNGLFEGGELGWVEEDGVVIRGGLIFEEEEVGRVAGPNRAAAAAGLLLLFLPQDFEANKKFAQR